MKIISRKEAKAQGLKRYFTGKPCKYGHVAERTVSSRECLKCSVERGRNRLATPEGKAAAKAATAKYNASPEGRVARTEYSTSPERRVAHRKWEAANQDKCIAKVARRRALRLKQTPLWCAPGTTAYDLIGEIYSDALHFSKAFGVEFHVDHKHPLAVGGSHQPDNLWLLPAATNMSKSAKTDWQPPAPQFNRVTWRTYL